MIKEKNEALINLTKHITVLLFNRVYRWMWVSTQFSTELYSAASETLCSLKGCHWLTHSWHENYLMKLLAFLQTEVWCIYW